MKTTYNIYKNCEVVKLREYSKSYGSRETIKVSFIKEFNNEIWLLNNEGQHIRTLRKHTKLLISYSGILITERSFKILRGKNKKENAAKRLEFLKIEEEKKQAEILALQPAKEFILANIEVIKRLVNKEKQNGNGRRTALWKLTGRIESPFTVSELYQASYLIEDL